MVLFQASRGAFILAMTVFQKNPSRSTCKIKIKNVFDNCIKEKLSTFFRNSYKLFLYLFLCEKTQKLPNKEKCPNDSKDSFLLRHDTLKNQTT